VTTEVLYLLVAGVSVLVVAAIFFVGLRSRSRAKAPPAPPREAPAPPAPAPEAPSPEAAPDIEIPEAPPAAAVPPAPAPPKISVADRFSRGLAKSRLVLSERLNVVLGKDQLSDEDWDEIEEALIRADVGVKAATKIVTKLRNNKPAPSELKAALADEMVSVLFGRQRQLAMAPGATNVWLVTGVNGVGKTTSIAKLAHRMKTEGSSVVVAAADTFRAAAIDQLGTWAERVDVPMIRHDPGSDPGAVLFDAISYAKARNIDLVIADTAGRLHTKTNLMDELKKIKRVAEREAGSVAEVLLVLDATVGQNGISQARTFQEAIEVSGVILTKLDGTAKGGIVLAVEQELGIPVKAVGVGETLDDLQPFVPGEFVDALLADS